MSTPYIGEIRIFAGNFAPVGWAFCDGQLLAISENDVLFNLIGTMYGGDGQSTFALPDLRGRVPVHVGQGPGTTQSYVIGDRGGAESVTLTTQQLPAHSHTPLGSSDAGTQSSPANGVWAASALNGYSANAPTVPMAASAIAPAGGSQPHDNMVPFTPVNFIISLYGLYPSPN